MKEFQEIVKKNLKEESIIFGFIKKRKERQVSVTNVLKTKKLDIVIKCLGNSHSLQA